MDKSRSCEFGRKEDQGMGGPTVVSALANQPTARGLLCSFQLRLCEERLGQGILDGWNKFRLVTKEGAVSSLDTAGYLPTNGVSFRNEFLQLC